MDSVCHIQTILEYSCTVRDAEGPLAAYILGQQSPTKLNHFVCGG